MHSQVFDFQSGQENFDIRFPAGESLLLQFEHAPVHGERVLTIGTDALAPPLIEVSGAEQVALSADALESIPEGRLCIFNLWQRDGEILDLVAEGRFVRRATIAPALPDAPFTASATGPVLLFDGDSVMHNMPGTRIFLEQLLGHKFRFPQGYQMATGGDSAQKIFFGAPEVAAQVERDNTVVLVGPIGANQTPVDDSFEEITGYLEQVFHRYLAAGAIVVAVPTLLDGMGVTTQDVKKSALADWVTAFANGGTVSYNGTDHVLSRHAGFHAVDVSGFDRDTMKSDVSHPNALGAKHLASALAEVLSPLVSGSIFAAPEFHNYLEGAADFQGSRASANPGITGLVPTGWDASRSEGQSLWQTGFDDDGVFEVSVFASIDDGTCLLTVPAVAINAALGDIVSFAAEIEIIEGATGLKSVGVFAQGQSPMTLDPKWAVSPGTYYLRTQDLPYTAAQSEQNFQIFIRVTSGASVTIRFHKAAAFFVENMQGALGLTGDPDTSAMVGSAYMFQPTVNGGEAPFVFDFAGGSLPAGLSLNPSTGVISGTPAEITLEQGIVIRVTDATGDMAVLPYFSIDVLSSGLPENQSMPTIDVTAPDVGDVLTADPGLWSNSPSAFHYQWRADGVDVVGATSPTYAVQAQDVGAVMSVTVVAVNGAGASGAISSAVTSPVQPIASATWETAINTAAPLQLAYSSANSVVGATASITGMRHTRGAEALTGKRYFEFLLGPQVLGVGVSTSSVTALHGGVLGADRCFWSGGFLFHTGSNANMGGPLAEGDIIQIAVDVDAQVIWMRRNGSGDWNNAGGADPATGVGGLNISGLVGDLYAYVSLQNDASAAVTLIGKAGEYTYSAPAGFNPIV